MREVMRGVDRWTARELTIEIDAMVVVVQADEGDVALTPTQARRVSHLLADAADEIDRDTLGTPKREPVGPNVPDSEVAAMRAIVEAFELLADFEQIRVIRWAADRYNVHLPEASDDD